MSLIQEVFLETDWEESAAARAARDQRAEQLKAQGLLCICTTLQRVTDGCNVFLVEAQEPETIKASHQSSTSSQRPRPRGRRDHEVDYR